MNTLKLLRESTKWEFDGNEKEFETNIIENIDQIIDCLGLSKATIIKRQKQFRFNGGQIIIDILVKHEDNTLTVFEVKKPNANNGWTSPHAQMQAIGQLLLYQNVIEWKSGAKPRLILIDNKIHERTYLSFIGNNLPITLVEFQKNRLFVPYRAF